MQSHNNINNDSALLDAITKNDIATVTELLKTKHAPSQAIYHVNTTEMLALLLNHATNECYLKELLQYRDAHDDCSFSYQASAAHLTLVTQLMQIKEWHQYANLEAFLHYARFSSWNQTAQFHDWDSICKTIKQFMPNSPLQISCMQTHLTFITAQHAYKQLFEDDYPLLKPTSKQQAIKRTLAQLYALLGTPHFSLSYLQFINDEFERFLIHHHRDPIKEPNSDHYEFKLIRDVYYPIPNEHYIGQHKHNAFDLFLIALFEKYGLPVDSAQWIGFIPHYFADNMVARGMHVKENRYGLGLLHGTLSHSLQQAIIILAIGENDIDLQYYNEGTIKTLSLQEILSAFVTVKDKNLDNTWAKIRDERHPEGMSFRDPHRLSSTVMREGKAFKLNTLSNYLIDSFCKSYQKWFDAHKKIVRDTNASQFLEHLNELSLNRFNPIHEMNRYAIHLHQANGHTVDIADNKTTAVVYKKYPLIYNGYSPRTYSHECDHYLYAFSNAVFLFKQKLEKETGLYLTDYFNIGFIYHKDLIHRLNKICSIKELLEIPAEFLTNCLSLMQVVENKMYHDIQLATLFSLLKNANPRELFTQPTCIEKFYQLNNCIQRDFVEQIYNKNDTTMLNILRYYLRKAEESGGLEKKLSDEISTAASNNPTLLTWTNEGLMLHLVAKNPVLLANIVALKATQPITDNPNLLFSHPAQAETMTVEAVNIMVLNVAIDPPKL